MDLPIPTLTTVLDYTPDNRPPSAMNLRRDVSDGTVTSQLSTQTSAWSAQCAQHVRFPSLCRLSGEYMHLRPDQHCLHAPLVKLSL